MSNRSGTASIIYSFRRKAQRSRTNRSLSYQKLVFYSDLFLYFEYFVNEKFTRFRSDLLFFLWLDCLPSLSFCEQCVFK